MARFPLSMAALGIVLLLARRDGSFGSASIVAACYLVAAALCAPIQGRAADRFGQFVVLLVASSLFAVGISVLLIAARSEASWIVLGAALAGMGAPQSGNLARRRWAHILADREKLSTAFALEAVLDEVAFVAGPVLVTFLTYSILPEAGLAVTALLAVSGSWIMAANRSTEPPIAESRTGSTEPIKLAVLTPLVVSAFCLGILFGSTEIIVVAFATEQTREAWSGTILAIWAVGSLAAGLFVGSRQAPTDPVRRLRLASAGLALLFVPLPFIPNMVSLGVAMLLAGMMIAPTLIATMNLVELTSSDQRLTESLTWTSMGLSVGIAPGAVLAGLAVDSFSASTGFLVPLVAGILATTAAMFNRSRNIRPEKLHATQ